MLPLATCGFNEEAALRTSKLLFLVPLDAELRDSLDELWERRGEQQSVLQASQLIRLLHSLLLNGADVNIMAGCEYVLCHIQYIGGG